jgi:hypothetical protein
MRAMAGKKKAAKSPTKHKGPAPAPASPFDTLLDGLQPAVRDTAMHLRELALSTIEGLREGIYGHAPVMLALYSMGGPNTVVCGIQPRDGCCLFYLHRIEQDDVPDLTLAGVGKHARHLEFASPRSVPDKVLAGLLKLSVKRLG